MFECCLCISTECEEKYAAYAGAYDWLLHAPKIRFFTPPPPLFLGVVYGRSDVPINLSLHLEELDRPVDVDNFWAQTTEFLPRAMTPRFVPATRGVDVATQIEAWEVTSVINTSTHS